MTDVTADFTQTCHECDPPEVVEFRDGQRVPGPCPHEMPAVEVTGEQSTRVSVRYYMGSEDAPFPTDREVLEAIDAKARAAGVGLLKPELHSAFGNEGGRSYVEFWREVKA